MDPALSPRNSLFQGCKPPKVLSWVVAGVAIRSRGELFRLFQIRCRCFQSTKRLSCIFNERKLLRFICFLGPEETFSFFVSVSWRTLASGWGWTCYLLEGKKSLFNLQLGTDSGLFLMLMWISHTVTSLHHL